MSMTWEETREKAIETLETHTQHYVPVEDLWALNMAIDALRPVSREQVWRGEWVIQKDKHGEFIKKCSKCGFPISGWWGADKFCAYCGAPMTDEAMEMVLERLEALISE